jgi:hypothetical protein
MKKANELEAQQMEQLYTVSLVAMMLILIFCGSFWVGTYYSLDRPENFLQLSEEAVAIGIVCFIISYTIHRVKDRRNLRNLEFIAAVVPPCLVALILLIDKQAEVFILLTGFSAGFVAADLVFLGKKSLNTKTVASSLCICILVCAFTVATPGISCKTYGYQDATLDNKIIAENNEGMNMNETRDTMTFIIGNDSMNVDSLKFTNDTGTYVQFECECPIGNCTAIKVGNISYPVFMITTPLYPLDRNGTGGLLDTTSETKTENQSDPLTKYIWKGITFVKNPGNSTLWVKYDHPDDYETYPYQPNKDCVIDGNGSTAIGIAKYHIEEAKKDNDLGSVIGALIGIVATLITVPEPIVSKLTAALLAIVLACLVATNLIISDFLNDILQTEEGNGWAFIFDFGHFDFYCWQFLWFRLSVGAWRDWSWLLVWLDQDNLALTEGSILTDILNPYIDSGSPITDKYYYRVHYDSGQLEVILFDIERLPEGKPAPDCVIRYR